MAGGLPSRGYLAPEQYPGHHLSITEALDAVSMKLSQVDDMSPSLTLPMIQSFERAMCRALAVVRRHLNSHNSTSHKIPSEVLIMIASHLKADAGFITKATHICHYWRATLLSCPDLWTYLDFSRKNRALSFLDRSRSLPIHADLRNTDPSDTLAELLCKQVTRVSTLKISRFDGLEKLFRLSMASLKTLEVVRSADWFFPQFTRIGAKEFPALTSLTVEHHPSALSFRGALITHLRITISNLHQEVTHLPALLRSCELLQSLEIENRGGLEDSLRLPPDTLIPLPHLRIFEQTLHYDRHTAGIINSLDLLPSCSIVLRCIAGPTNGYPSPALPILRNTSCLTNLRRLKVVHVGGCLGNGASFTLSLINNRGTRFTAITEFTNFALSPPDMEYPRDDGIERSIPGIEVLCVADIYVPMEGFKSLTTLVLSGLVVRLYLEFLAGPEGREAYENLRRLVLFVDPSRPMTLPNPVRHLTKVARKRAKVGLPLRTVTFVYPSALSSDDLKILDELRAYAERVELLLGDETLDWNLDKYFLG